MGCHAPRVVWKRAVPNPKTGKFGFERSPRGATYGRDWTVPCGKCAGCRLDYSVTWAVRCEKESQLHEHNCFLTLTYGDDELPIGGSTRSTLSKRDFQLFMKRLRKRYGEGIRFFACGEYGDKNQRAHYHALLFGHDFADKRLWKVRPYGSIFISAELAELWPFGFSSLGAVSFRSAAYVARYVMKKLDGKLSDYADREPPFVLMSRRPGIGVPWFQKFPSDVYAKGDGDQVVARLVSSDGKVRKVPRIFRETLKRSDPELYARLRLSEVSKRRLFLTAGEKAQKLHNQELNAVHSLTHLPRPIER